jgi:hypothetical protein
MKTNDLPSFPPGRFLLLVTPTSMLNVLFEMVAHMALRGPLYVLDGGNIFQGYGLARTLRRQSGCDPVLSEEALQRVLLSRVFTCYQMEAMLNGETLAPHPLLALDLLSTFCDQSVRAAERRRLLHICIQRLNHLSQHVPVAVWVRQRSAVPPEALAFLEILQNAAGRVWYPERPRVLPVKQLPLLPV